MVMKTECFDINLMVILGGIVDPSQGGIFRPLVKPFDIKLLKEQVEAIATSNGIGNNIT